MDIKDPKLLKSVSLVCLTFQNALVALSMRYSRTRKGEMFKSSTAVLMAECIKFLTCIILVYLETGKSLIKFKNVLMRDVLKNYIDTLKVCVPSLLYVIQNNLLYLSASNLNAATYQVTYQLKILTTAIFAVIILKRSLQSLQWISLIQLIFGVVLVQLSQIDQKNEDNIKQSQVIGIAAALSACFLSGLAGIYFEKILKGSDISIWMRNIQLSLLSIPFGLITCLMNDFVEIKEKGFFYGYDAFIWYLVILQACGGLLVAAVVKYADNILKGFATSFAIILSCVGSVYFLNFVLTSKFILGAFLVIGSVFMYSYEPTKQKQINNKATNSETLITKKYSFI